MDWWLRDAGLRSQRGCSPVQVSKRAVRAGAQPLGGFVHRAVHHECLVAAPHGLFSCRMIAHSIAQRG